MPVLLTHPATAVARATASVLLDDGAQVRLFGPDAPAELRARGAFVAAADHDDHGKLEAALEQVHTMVHVGPGLLAPDEAALERAVHAGVLALDAAVRAGVQRVVLLSVTGASPRAADPVRVAAGRLEAHAEALPLPSVVVRTSLVDTPAVRDAVAALSSPPGDVVVAPVLVDDLARGLLAIDEARSAAETGHVVFRAVGDEPLTLDGWLERAGVRAGGATDFVGRVYRPAAADAPLRRALAGPWREPDGPTADLWAFAGFRPRAVGP